MTAICALCHEPVGRGIFTTPTGEPCHYWCREKHVQDATQATAKAIKSRGGRTLPPPSMLESHDAA